MVWAIQEEDAGGHSRCQRVCTRFVAAPNRTGLAPVAGERTDYALAPSRAIENWGRDSPEDGRPDSPGRTSPLRGSGNEAQSQSEQGERGRFGGWVLPDRRMRSSIKGRPYNRLMPGEDRR